MSVSLLAEPKLINAFEPRAQSLPFCFWPVQRLWQDSRNEVDVFSISALWLMNVSYFQTRIVLSSARFTWCVIIMKKSKTTVSPNHQSKRRCSSESPVLPATQFRWGESEKVGSTQRNPIKREISVPAPARQGRPRDPVQILTFVNIQTSIQSCFWVILHRKREVNHNSDWISLSAVDVNVRITDSVLHQPQWRWLI